MVVRAAGCCIVWLQNQPGTGVNNLNLSNDIQTGACFSLPVISDYLAFACLESPGVSLSLGKYSSCLGVHAADADSGSHLGDVPPSDISNLDSAATFTLAFSFPPLRSKVTRLVVLHLHCRGCATCLSSTPAADMLSFCCSVAARSEVALVRERRHWCRKNSARTPTSIELDASIYAHFRTIPSGDGAPG